MKIIGACFILLTTTYLGFEAARMLSERTRQLRLLKSALQSLEAEIMYGHAPLHEASRRIAKQIDKPVGMIFETFADKLVIQLTSAKEAWEESLTEVWKQTALKKGELEILLQFGETLGKHDLIQQQKHIQLALTHLDREEMEAKERQVVYGKIYKNFGFLAGLLVVILLI